MKQNKKITADELATILDVSARIVKRYLTVLQDKNMIKRTGSKKTGEWEIIKQ